MSLDQKFSLSNIFLLHGMDDVARLEFEKLCTWSNWTEKQSIITQGDPTDKIYFLISGNARVVNFSSSGKIVSFREIEEGEFFGELSALDGKARSATVEALCPCLTASTNSDRFWQLVLTEKSISRELILHFTAQIRTLSERVYEYSALAVNNRIHAELFRLAHENQMPDGSAIVLHPPTHSEIALRISTHREAVSREIARLTRTGLIAKGKDTLVINDLDKLREIVEAKSLGLLTN